MARTETVSQAQAIIKSPSAFMKFVYGKQPFGYQKRFLEDESGYVSWVAGRQVGKSLSLANRALHHALTKPNYKIMIASSSLKQARIIFDNIRAGIYHPFIQEHVVSDSLTRISFKNGSLIENVVAGLTGRTSRGFSPDELYIDEAASIPAKVFAALTPSIAATHGKLIMTSTPFGKRGRFYESTKLPFYSVHRVSALDCPLITKEFLEQERNSMTDMEFRQEYLAEFVAEADTWFSPDLVLQCINDQTFIHNPNEQDTYLGVDLARFGTDDSVYTLVQAQKNGVLRVFEIQSTSRLPLTDAIGRIKALHKEWHFRRIFVDETGLGAGVADVIRESNLPITPVTFTLEEKEVMYKGLKRLMENTVEGKTPCVWLPDNQKLKYQLIEMEYEYTSGSHIKFHHADGGHDDFNDSLALACHAFLRTPPGMRLGRVR